MKRLKLLFILLCKRQLKSAVLVCFLVAMPLMSLLMNLLPSMNEARLFRIGLYATADNQAGRQAIDYLTSNDEGIIFYMADSPESLREDILNQETDCGYIIKDNLVENILEHKLDNLIVRICDLENVITQTSGEVVFSAVLRSVSKDIAIRYINDHGFFAPDTYDSAMEYFHKQFAALDEGGSSLVLNFTIPSTGTGDDTTREITTGPMTFPIRGINAIILLIACVLGAGQWITDRNNNIFRMMSPVYVFITRILYSLIPALIFGASALLSALLGDSVYGFMTELLALLVYIVILIAFCTLLTFIAKKEQHILSALPVLILFSLLMCPVFIDLSIYLPVLRAINKILPPFYYLTFF